MALHSLITTDALPLEDIEALLSLARRLRTEDPGQPLTGRTLLLAFLSESTRTKASFVEAARQLGANVRDVTAGGFAALKGDEPARAMARIADEGDAIGIRHPLVPGKANTFIETVAGATERPVYNLQCDLDHPIQTLADLATLRARFGADLSGRTVAVTWAYNKAPSQPASVSQGLLSLLPRLGMTVRLAHPPGFELPKAALDRARKGAEAGGGRLEVVADMDAAVEGADAVYPRAWAPFDLLHQPEEASALAAPFAGWILNEERFARAAPDAVFMHCLPARRGEEVADAVIDSDRSLIYQQADNRLALTKAVLLSTMQVGAHIS
ncbi:MAG: ornithine carbamoyltransferase [Bradymonadia bacterium]